MKKSVLLSAIFIPIIFGCAKNATPGIENPFPDDEYINKKIGFKIADNEVISRALTTKEINRVNDVISKKDEIDEKIVKEIIESHKRDYIRAFAGEFKQGYSSSNVLEDEEITIIKASKQDAVPELRKLTKRNSKSIKDYSYGRIENTKRIKTQRYFMKKNESLKPEETTNKESTNISDRIKTIENPDSSSGGYSKTIDALVSPSSPSTPYTKDSGEEWDKSIIISTFNMKQSEYITEPDVNAGADKNDNVILIKEDKKEYKGTGIYTLNDGRKYRAMENSIQVAKLKQEEDYYVVDYARKYTETTITSKEIQPNVQISMLSEPIVISFVEEIHHFYNTCSDAEKIEALDTLEPLTEALA